MTGSAAAAPEAAGRSARLRALDRFDLAVFLCLGALSLAFLVWIVRKGGVFGGWEGFVVADQGQYLDWIRQSGEHVLIGNNFDMRPDSPVFLHPLLLLSGLLYDLGLSLPAAYLLWKPIALVVLFYGVWRYTRHSLAGLWERRAALVLALFFVSPLSVVSSFWGDTGRGTFDFVSGEIWPAGFFWGYPMTALAVGLTPLVFVWSERLLGGGGRRERVLAAAAALLVAWLHPWQGAMLIGTLGLAGLWHVRARGSSPREAIRALGPTLAAALAPVIYYFLLPRVDDTWAASEDTYRAPLDGTLTWRLALALAPLALPALLGYRGRARGFGDRILWLWVPVGLALYLAPPTPVRFHAFNGLSIPLAVLATRGVAPYVARAAGGRRALAVAAVLVACAFVTIPGAVDRIRSARGAVYRNEQPYVLEPGERDALAAIARRPGGGGVLTSVELAALVPERTGREVWVGTPSWSPDFGPRALAASTLFSGLLRPAQARRVVRESGVRFVLQQCRSVAPLARDLAPLAVSSQRYGCASVFEVRRSP